MKDLIKKLCKGKMLRDKLEKGYADHNYDLISRDPEGYIKNPDHHWRYNPHWKDRHTKETWYTHRQGSVLATLIKDSGHSTKMKSFYKWCKEVFDNGN
jgi:hypothetical protein